MDIPEIELTLQDITEGSKVTKKVVLVSDNPNYDGKTVIVRSLTASEFAKITDGLHQDGMDIAEAIKLGLAACKIGILNKDLANKIDMLPTELADQIGSKILGYSKPKEKQVSDFSEAPKAV